MNLPSAAAIVVAATAFAVALMLLLRRQAPAGGFGVLATSFSVMLAFIVYLAFTSYDTTRTAAESEATAVFQQVETAELLPRAARPRLAGQLVCYGRAVVHE